MVVACLPRLAKSACAWSWLPSAQALALTVLSARAPGVLVSLVSSIGAGAIGATLILLIYPRLESHARGRHRHRPRRAADVRGRHRPRHARPCGLEPARRLLIGSVPGIWIGAQLTRHARAPGARACCAPRSSDRRPQGDPLNPSTRLTMYRYTEFDRQFVHRRAPRSSATSWSATSPAS